MGTRMATAGTCCGGQGCLDGCGEGDGGSAQPPLDRFDGFQIPVGEGPETRALAARLDGREGGGTAVRLGSPAEVAAAIPHFFGFHPDASVVVLGLSRSDQDGRAAISHGLRVDLSAATRSPAAFGRWMAGRLLETGANEALCVIYPPEGGPARMADYRRVVAGMCTPLRLADVAPLDVLFVSDGRWWSFLCDRPACCPPDGSPVDAGVSAIAALSAYSGLAVLPNRAALAAGLEPYGPEMAERMRASCDDALNRIAAERSALHPEPADLGPADITPHPDPDPASEPEPASEPAAGAATREATALGTDGARDTSAPIGSHDPTCCDSPAASPLILDFDWGDVARAWQLADSLCAGQVPPDRALTDEAAGELLVALADVRVRDYLATWCGDDRAGQAVALGVELGRRAVTAEQSAAAYSVAAWAAWALGWGAWSRLCLERASKAVPGYTLASLIKQGLDRGVGPELVRKAARGTASRLEEMRVEHCAEAEHEQEQEPRRGARAAGRDDRCADLPGPRPRSGAASSGEPAAGRIQKAASSRKVL
jgi:hypothetical protein